MFFVFYAIKDSHCNGSYTLWVLKQDYKVQQVDLYSTGCMPQMMYYIF